MFSYAYDSKGLILHNIGMNCSVYTQLAAEIEVFCAKSGGQKSPNKKIFFFDTVVLLVL